MKNNKGFSLVELIIVIAILSILTSVSIVALGYVHSTNIKNTIKKIDASLLMTQNYTISKSMGGGDISMSIEKDNDGFLIKYEGMSGHSEERIAKKNVTIKYETTNGSKIIETSSPLKICFDRSTGGLLPLGTSENGTNIYCESIEISVNGASKCSVDISKVTGKTEIRLFHN